MPNEKSFLFILPQVKYFVRELFSRKFFIYKFTMGTD